MFRPLRLILAKYIFSPPTNQAKNRTQEKILENLASATRPEKQSEIDEDILDNIPRFWSYMILPS